MGRKARYNRDAMFEAGLKLFQQRGLAAVSMKAIASHLGAPSGSVYHRFSSREEFLARLWLHSVRDFQDHFLKALETGPEEAALSVVHWATKNPGSARLLLSHQREELLAEPWPADIKEEAKILNLGLETALKPLVDTHGKEAVLFALVDVPYGTARRLLRSKSPPSPRTLKLIQETVRLSLGTSD